MKPGFTGYFNLRGEPVGEPVGKPRQTKHYVTVVVVKGVAGRAAGDVMTLPPVHAARWIRKGRVRPAPDEPGPAVTKPDGPSVTKPEPEPEREREPRGGPLAKRLKGGGVYEILDASGAVVGTVRGKAAADAFIESMESAG